MRNIPKSYAKKLRISRAFILGFCGQLVQAQNAIWYVSSAGNGNGTSWASASHDLQATIDNAVAGDQVWIKQGTYQRAAGQFFSVRDGVSLYGGFPATANPGFGDRNPGLYKTKLQGNEARVLEAAGIFEPINPNTIIDGLTIQNGSAPTGAGIAISFCDATFRNIHVVDNVASLGFGAGMSIFNSNSTFIQVLVTDNTSLLAPGYEGDSAGIKITGGTTRFYNCVVANNHAQGYIGGIWLNSNTTCYFYNSIIYGNTAGLTFDASPNENYYGLNNVNFYASHCILEGCRGSDYLNEMPVYQIYGIDQGRNLDANPMFNADYALQPGSVGINKGDNAAFQDALHSPDQDFFGSNRIVDRIDIGLSEYQTVQSDILYVRENGSGDGSSWANASGDLQLMMDKQFEGRSVYVAEETYFAPLPYFKLRDKVKVYGGFPATGNPGFADRNIALHPTVLTSTHQMTVVGNFYPPNQKISSQTLLDGVTLTRNENSPVYMLGLFESYSDVSYINVTFTGFNYGAVEVRRASDNSFTDCSFTNNHAIDTPGVHYPITVSMIDGAHTAFTRCIFTGNKAFHTSALAVKDDSHAVVDGCLFADNNDMVSGIGKVLVVENANATITNSIFERNGFGGVDGGILLVNGTESYPDAPWLVHPVNVVVDRCIFRNNPNTALWCQAKDGDQISISNTLFYENTGAVGGAIRRHSAGNLYLTNCTLTQNHATSQWGGGFYTDETSAGDLGVTQIRNSIIYNNTSVYPDGQNLRTSRPLQIRNSILQGSGGSGNWDAGAFNDFNVPDMTLDWGGNLDVNPLFIDAANQDFRLLEASPAVNAGDNALYNAAATPNLSLLLLDLTGNARILENTVDMGAYEFDATMGLQPFETTQGISMYPNPAHDRINIDAGLAQLQQVKIYSLLGKELLTTTNDQIDTSALPNGMYLVQVWLSDGKTHTGKLVKK